MTSDCVGAAGCGSVRAIAWYGNGYHAYPNLGCGTGIGAYGGWSGYGIPLPGTQNVDYAGESVIPAPPAVPAGNLPTKTDSPLKDNPPTKLDKGGKGLQPTPIPMNPEKKLILPTPVPVAPGAENPNKKKSILDDDLQARAFITLSVPAGARLFVDGKRIENSTLVRTFRTPPLVAGEAYFYDIRIEFEQDGKTAVENQRVIVTPGQRLAADFRYLSQTVVAGR